MSAVPIGRPRVCKRCKFTTTDIKEFTTHQQTAHSTESIEVYACEKCDYISQSYDDLITHKRTLHPVAPPTLASAKSNASVRNGETRKRTAVNDVHSITCSSPDAAEDRYNDPTVHGTPIIYSCSQCQHVTDSSKQFLKHRKTEHSDPATIYECPLCEYASRYKSRLQKHSKTQHEDIVELPDASSDEGDLQIAEEGVSEEQFIPEGGDPNDSDSNSLKIDEDANSEKTYKSPLQIVMDMNHIRTTDPSTMNASFLEAMASSLARQPSAKSNNIQPKRLQAVGKPRCTPVREAVDPAKYMTIQEGDGVKYACSKCGNIYKWRKSLNKHWKEKHDGEVPDPRPSVAALSIPSARMGVTAPRLLGVPQRNQPIHPIPSKPFRSQAMTSSMRPQPLFGVSTSSSHHLSSALTRPLMYQRPLTLNDINPTALSSPQLSMQSNKLGIVSSIPSSISSPFQKPASLSFIHQPDRVPSPSIPPAAHAHNKALLTPPSSHKSSVSSSIYDEPFDEQEGVLDLSKKTTKPDTNNARPPTPPTQDEPIDFSKTLSAGFYPPPPLTVSPSRRHLLHPAFAQLSSSLIPPLMMTSKDNPIVIEPTNKVDDDDEDDIIVDDGGEEEEHINDHKPTQKHPCSICTYSGTTSQDLEAHMQLHVGATGGSNSSHHRSHPCAECPAVYHSGHELNTHFTMCHTDVLQGKLNDTMDRDNQALIDVLKLPVEQRPSSISIAQENTCLVCGDYFQWQDSLAEHFSQIHPDLPNPYSLKSSMTCSQCDYTTTCPMELSEHHKMEHPDDKSENGGKSPADGRRTPDSDKSAVVMTPDGKMLDFEGENTAIVIPTAPEDNLSTPSKRGRKCAPVEKDDSSAELLLPYKCQVCEYRARWPSEITQHMKNHSDEKPFKCPRCSYRSKWKWDVVKHLKRCGGGTVKDVIDTTKERRQHHVNTILAGVPTIGADSMAMIQGRELSKGPPNVTVMPPKSRESSLERDDMSNDTTDESEYAHKTQQIAQHYCPHCPFSCASAGELKRHQRVHSEDKPFICKTCGYCSKWKCDLKKHLRTYGHQSAVPLVYGGHGRKPADWDQQKQLMKNQELNNTSDEDVSNEPTPVMLQCSMCPYATSKQHLLDSHMNIHSPLSKLPGKLKCKQCDYTADDLTAFLQHKLKHQVDNNNTTKQVDDSSLKLGRRKQLKEKLIKAVMNKSDDDCYSCSLCTWVGDSNVELESHMHNEHADDEYDDFNEDVDYNANGITKSNQEETKKRLRKCEKCAYTTDSVSTLQRHSEKHGKDGRFTCSYCDYSVDREYVLDLHLVTVHKNKINGANECNSMGSEDDDVYDFSKTVSNGNHIDRNGVENDATEFDDDKKEAYSVLQIHRGNRTTYSCRKCPYKADNLTNVANHVKQHGAGKKYQCDHCDYSSDQFRHVSNHMTALHGESLLDYDDDDVKDEDDEIDEEEYNESDVNHNDDNEAISDVSENEWEIAEVEEQDESPAKRRRLSSRSTGIITSPNKVLKYTCKTCGYNTVNKNYVAKHNHKDNNTTDINRNTTTSIGQ